MKVSTLVNELCNLDGEMEVTIMDGCSEEGIKKVEKYQDRVIIVSKF